MSNTFMVKTVNLSLEQAVEVHRVVRHRGSHIFQTIGSQMAVRLPAAPVALYPQEDLWYSFLLEADSTPGLLCCWKG
jgi:hypothetical protein